MCCPERRLVNGDDFCGGGSADWKREAARGGALANGNVEAARGGVLARGHREKASVVRWRPPKQGERTEGDVD